MKDMKLILLHQTFLNELMFCSNLCNILRSWLADRQDLNKEFYLTDLNPISPHVKS